MFYKLEPRPKNSNCPYCQSTETFISTYKESRYCNNCDRTYNGSDEVRLAEQKMDKDFHIEAVCLLNAPSCFHPVKLQRTFE